MTANRFRFRAWGKHSQTMSRIFEFDDLESYASRLAIKYPGKTRFFHSVLMQSTGLLDKNGKEIFEGDLIECIWEVGDPSIEEVRWDCNCWAPLHNCVGFNPVRFGAVIGNRYQNPELLKEHTK